jgi:hypothetical protein
MVCRVAAYTVLDPLRQRPELAADPCSTGPLQRPGTSYVDRHALENRTSRALVVFGYRPDRVPSDLNSGHSPHNG